MQTSVRYYITRSEDQPIVRTVPVALREEATHETQVAASEQPGEPERNSRRVPKIVRPALRRAARISSDKL